jgi:hypothetical protein
MILMMRKSSSVGGPFPLLNGGRSAPHNGWMNGVLGAGRLDCCSAIRMCAYAYAETYATANHGTESGDGIMLQKPDDEQAGP